MSDTISVTIEERKIEITVNQPNFIQVNLLEPVVLESVSENTNHRLTVSGNPHGVTKTDVGLGNVTDDIQLKRSAGDFQAFTVINPVDDDSFILEDSTDGGNKKRTTLGRIITRIFNRVSLFVTGSGGVVDKGSVAVGPLDFDASEGSSQKATITAALALTSSGWETDREQAVNLWITISGGPLTLAIPGEWNDKDALFTAMANGLHLIQIVTIDTGASVEVLGGAR